MELRSCNHLHVIKAVRGGLVTQVLNVRRGRPSLVFKCVKDIYENAKKTTSCPILSPEDEVDGSTVDSVKVKVEYECLPMVHRRTIKCIPESSGLDCNNGDEIGESDLEDMLFSEITLKQIKERCNKKKRKHPNDSKSSEEACPRREQDYSKPQTEEDEHDLMMPLSCWKSKFSKKAKRKCLKDCHPMLSKGVASIVKLEEFHDFEDIRQQKEDFHVPTDTKVVVSTSDYLDEQETVCIAVDSSSGCSSSNEVDAPKLGYLDAQSMVCVTGDSLAGFNENVDSAVEIPESDFSDAEITTHIAGDSSFSCNQNPCVSAAGINCDGNEGCYDTEALEPDCSNAESMVCVAGESVFRFKEMGSDEVVSSPILNEANECVLEAEVQPFFSEGAQCCLVVEDHVSMEPADFKSLSLERGLEKEIMETRDPESINRHCSELHLPKCNNDGFLSSNTISSPTNCSEICDDSQSYSSTAGVSWETEIEVPDTAVGINLQNMELTCEDGQCALEKGSEDYFPCTDEDNLRTIPLSNFSPSLKHDPCFRSDSCPASDSSNSHVAEEKQPTRIDSYLASVNDLPTAEEKQQLLPTVSDAAIDTSFGVNHYAVTDEPESLPGDRNCEYKQFQHIPKRLFSARKSISPTIRKRLCKALESDGCCHDEPCQYCGDQLFGKQTANEDAIVGDPSQIRTGNVICLDQNTKKRKNDKKGSPPKEKQGSHLSRAKPSANSGCDSIRICSENAIAFSQQQMRDIERIATRLTEELRSMKSLVEERMCSQVSPTKFAKYNADEVGISVANAKKAEETTQKWLTMMAKDCKRFCKIMSLTEKDSSGNGVHLQSLREEGSAASGNVVHKKRKITFADEAGGKLCHVKIFEDDTTCPSELGCYQPELLPRQL